MYKIINVMIEYFSPLKKILLLLTICSGFNYILAQDQLNENIVHFKWNFVVAPSGKLGFSMQKITKDTILHTGDDFKLFFQLNKPSFIYVIHKSSENEISLLFPKSFTHDDEESLVGKKIFIPQNNEWYKLDSNTGLEIFHILVSSARLDHLEALLIKYLESGNEKKKDLSDAIIIEIKELKKKYRSFISQPERPINIAGSVRAIDENNIQKERTDITTLSEEVVTTTFFSKTITIDHQ